MHIRLAVCSIVLASAAFVSPAAAQDWSGFYAGAGVTFGSGQSDADVTLGGQWSSESAALQSGVTSNWSPELEPDGVGGGLFAGYNWQTSGGFVFGGEVSYDFVNVEEDRSTGQIAATSTFPALTYDFQNSVDVSGVVSARANLGFAFDQLLVYGTLGVAAADTTVAAEILSNGGYSKAGEGSEWVNGMVYGLGAAFQPSQNWFISGQWVRADLGEQTFTTVYRPGSTFTAPAYTESFTQDLTLDIFRLGVGFRF